MCVNERWQKIGGKRNKGASEILGEDRERREESEGIDNCSMRVREWEGGKHQRCLCRGSGTNSPIHPANAAICAQDKLSSPALPFPLCFQKTSSPHPLKRLYTLFSPLKSSHSLLFPPGDHLCARQGIDWPGNSGAAKQK